MSRPSFLQRTQPVRQRSKLVDWPFAVEGDAPKQVRVRLLSQADMEQAYFAARDYFSKLKAAQRPGVQDLVFAARERTELVWRAFRDPESDEPIAATADELADQGLDVVAPLFAVLTEAQASLIAPLRFKSDEQTQEVQP